MKIAGFPCIQIRNLFLEEVLQSDRTFGPSTVQICSFSYIEHLKIAEFQPFLEFSKNASIEIRLQSYSNSIIVNGDTILMMAVSNNKLMDDFMKMEFNVKATVLRLEFKTSFQICS